MPLKIQQTKSHEELITNYWCKTHKKNTTSQIVEVVFF